MLVYHDQSEEAHAAGNGRYIPYSETSFDGDGAYYNFLLHPELIPTSLEDFTPFQHRPAVRRFYEMLAWMNGPVSILESTDCLLRPPAANATPSLGGGASLQVIGRVVFIYRDHALNTSDDHFYRLIDELHSALASVDQGWKMGACGYARYPAHFVALASEPKEGVSIGGEVCVRFWAWGNTEDECFANLDRLFGNLDSAVRTVSLKIGALSITKQDSKGPTV
jgi:hypothetical protein